ncbi:unnamed protein product [Polarella glacialis]|uniref:Uncharacterized protein n=2 Tax=Polarella glacialis TaxID=89957 RepID=A0A813IWS2_POLGL|nr:unnamed protein product [Polarella glacialis]
MAATRASRSRKQGLPLMPCLCFGLAFVLFAATLPSSALPEVGVGFVGASRQLPERHLTKRNVEGEWKPSIRDRGTPEYAEYMERNRRERASAMGLSSAAPAPSAGGGGQSQEGGNPFQFLIDLVLGTTTTTTTTTPPPNPIEGFFRVVRDAFGRGVLGQKDLTAL